MWIVALALRRPYTFVVMALVATLGAGAAWRLLSGLDTGTPAAAPLAASGLSPAGAANAAPFDVKGIASAP